VASNLLVRGSNQAYLKHVAHEHNRVGSKRALGTIRFHMSLLSVSQLREKAILRISFFLFFNFFLLSIDIPVVYRTKAINE